jgi:uncharacterized protein (TIGR02118 family)
MIKVSVLYPSGDGIRFDMTYYLGTHIPLVRRLLGGDLKQGSVDQGISGGEPGSRAPFIAVGHLFFDSTDAFQKAMAEHGEQLLNDIPNYTNAQPLIQVNEVKL